MSMKELEEQIADWIWRMDKEPQKVAIEVAVAQFTLLYNINENISLIRDILAKRSEQKQQP